MHSPPETPRSEPSLGDLVMRTAHVLRSQWRERLAPWDLSPHQGRALGTVARAGSLRLSDLAAQLRIAPRSATEVVDGLAERDLVRRVPDPADRRATLVELTAAGQRVQAEMQASRGADTAAVFASLSDSDAKSLARILGEVIATAEAGDVPGRPQTA